MIKYIVQNIILTREKGRFDMKALIVDDHNFVIEGLKSLIDWRGMGFETLLEANNGEAALQIILDSNPDLVVTDVKMPVMDGIELIKSLREITVDTYIIMLSAYDEWEYARVAMQYGVRDFIIKPLSEENIQQLSAEIKYIVSDLKRKKSFRSEMSKGKQIEESITNTLVRRETSQISHLFERELPNMDLRPDDAKNYCILLTNILFNYLDKLEYPHSGLNEHEVEAIEHIHYIKNVQELYNYTYQLYLEFLNFDTNKVDNSKPYAEQIKKYISDHYNEDALSVENIADELNLTPAYVGSIFKQNENINLITYINNFRIKKASELLLNDTLAISEIGQMVGITDPNYFTRLFKRLKGITPTEFRSILFMNI